jgi:hypothetical protein
MRKLAVIRVGLLIFVTIWIVGCGRSGLDFGVPSTTNVTVAGAAGMGGTGGDGSSGAGAGGLSGGTGGSGQEGPAPGVQPTQIPCGNTACTSGTEQCCITGAGRRATAACVPVQTVCPVGAGSIGCIDNSACGAGEVCCESLLSPVTSCLAPESCGGDTDCPSLASHCCQAESVGICSAQSCPVPPGLSTGPQGS